MSVVQAKVSSYVSLGSVAKIYSGGTPSRSNPDYWGGDIPWIKTAHIRGNKIGLCDVDEFITTDGLENSSAKIVPKDTILMAMYGQGKTRGRVSILDIGASINQACCAIEVLPNHCPEYVFQYLKSKYESIRLLSNDGSQKNLTAGIIKRFKIYSPSYEEQKSIAKALQTWDAAIEKTEALIEAKERQFRWLAAKLIGDNTSYLSRLGDHFGKDITIEKGKPLIKANIAQDGIIPVIAGGKTSPYKHDQSTHSTPCITVSASGAYAGYVWFHGYPIWASDCNVIHTAKHSIEYLYFALKLKQSRIYAFQSGGGQPHVYARDLKNITCRLPYDYERLYQRIEGCFRSTRT